MRIGIKCQSWVCFLLLYTGRYVADYVHKHLRRVVSESYKWKNLLSITRVHLFKSNTTKEPAKVMKKFNAEVKYMNFIYSG